MYYIIKDDFLKGVLPMNKKCIITLIAVCAAVGAAVAAIILFREEISDFIKSVINKLERLRYRRYDDDCCFDGFDDFDIDDEFEDFEDVCSPF